MSTGPSRLDGIPAVLAACCAVILISPIAAQETEQADDFIQQSMKFAGIRQFKSGTWGVAGIELVNLRDDPVEVVTGLYFEGDPLSRFSRRVWIPARSRRTTSFPVRPSERISGKLKSRPFLYEAADHDRILLRKATEQLLEADQLPLVEPPVTVIVGAWNDAETDALLLWRETVIAMRLNNGFSPRITRMTADEIPAFHLGLEAVDQIVIVGSELAESPTGLDTIRAFLQRGGRVWIPLDRVEQRVVDLLLGDAARIVEVDRISLPELQIQNVLTNQPSGPARTFDEPVDLVRVLASEVVVSHEVNGWPAAFWLDVGFGRVIFTTLGARGWIRPRLPEEHLQQQPELNSRFVAQQPLVEVMAQLTRPLNPPPLKPQDFQQYLQAQVGYQIPGRGTVLTILGLFCLTLAGLGAVFQRTGRLERLIWAGPLAALCATAPLIVFGESSRRAVPPTVAIAEVVHVGPDATATQSTGLAAIYVPETSAAEVVVRRNALVIPPREQTEGTVRQMVWTDLDDWYWEDLELNTGLHFSLVEQHRTLDEAIRATCTFGPDGLHGRLETGPYIGPSDALIATETQHALAVQLDPPGNFSAGRGDLLRPGIYMQDSLLTDEQNRRRTIYERMLQSHVEFRYPNRPTLLVWTHPVQSDFEFPEGMFQSCTALLAIPLEIQPPAPGSEVFIPSPFLPIETVVDANGNVTTAFDRRTRQWRTTTYPTDTLLRFPVPEALVPMDATHAKLSVGIRAPQRTVQLATGLIGQLVPLEPIEDAVGKFEFEIDQSDALQLDTEGGLHVRLQVGDLNLNPTDDPDGKEFDRSWKLVYIRLELTGRTAEAFD